MTNVVVEELKTLATELRAKLAEVEKSIANFIAGETSKPEAAPAAEAASVEPVATQPETPAVQSETPAS